MLRRSPRAVLLWAAAIVVAIVTATSVGGTLASLHRQDNRYGRVRAVVVAARDLAAGTVVDRSDVREVQVRGNGGIVIGIRDGNNAGAHGDLVAGQRLRIA